ncbi:nucleotidyltransferase domain-containing protein [Thalassobacillus pellis]|uniref:nucleotidyltransferase domain-containing protein n=1 Tax=Thalassobacillus pellis TaxID=748008 RepID=UPI00195F4FF8|nr:nucleotidyltransferase domain-containing protein [Thalassobacillus pellis]MBM7552249.1 hypothetical protein [Thalassobacillus pellis]
MKLDAKEAAEKIVHTYYPHCEVALLSGSVVRGEATKTSDLDIVLFDDQLLSSYRESFHAYGWPVEVFAHSFSSYQKFYKSDCERGRPSLPRMVAEGYVIKGDAVKLKEEAEQLLASGPASWDEKKIWEKRYFITDVLEDFIGSEDRAEEIFIVNKMADLIHEFVLRTNRCWTGDSKWVIKAIQAYDPVFAKGFVKSLERYYVHGEKEPLIKLVDEVLAPYGGRLFAGFSLGKKNEKQT